MAISYDSLETLKSFASARAITFPLVADPGSEIIKRFGLLNTTVAPGTRTHGIPFPGTYIVDRQGVVRSRHFEDAYQERTTVSNILARRGAPGGEAGVGPAIKAETKHLTLHATVSDAVVAPGSRISLVVDVTPRPGMHVYAPGKHTYQVIRLTIDPQPWLRSENGVYPASEIYHFKPLNERVEVYQKPFRLLQDVTILATQEAQKLLAGQKNVSISGQLEYQACDDQVCYSPQRVPLSWALEVKPLVR